MSVDGLNQYALLQAQVKNSSPHMYHHHSYNKSNLHTLLMESEVAVFYIRSKAAPPPAPGQRKHS
jgi:hypothetical protein